MIFSFHILSYLFASFRYHLPLFPTLLYLMQLSNISWTSSSNSSKFLYLPTSAFSYTCSKNTHRLTDNLTISGGNLIGDWTKKDIFSTNFSHSAGRSGNDCPKEIELIPVLVNKEGTGGGGGGGGGGGRPILSSQ